MPDTAAQASKPKKPRTTSKKNSENFDWDKLRRQACGNYQMKERIFDRRDSVDWEAVRCADVQRISHAIRERGMNNVLAERIQVLVLDRLPIKHCSWFSRFALLDILLEINFSFLIKFYASINLSLEKMLGFNRHAWTT